jgi:hypothetical protein
MLSLHLRQSVAKRHGTVAGTNVLTSRRVLAPPPNFRKSAWMPTHETIDEQDRQKRVMIHTRFEDADQDRWVKQAAAAGHRSAVPTLPTNFPRCCCPTAHSNTATAVVTLAAFNDL